MLPYGKIEDEGLPTTILEYMVSHGVNLSAQQLLLDQLAKGCISMEGASDYGNAFSMLLHVVGAWN